MFRKESSLQTRIAILILVLIIPLGGISFYVINGYQKPIKEYQTMMENITAANDVSNMTMDLISKDFYDALSNLSDTEKIQNFKSKVNKILDLDKSLSNQATFENERSILIITGRLLQTFREKCFSAVNESPNKEMKSRLNDYKEANNTYEYIKNTYTEYINIQISNRQKLNDSLKMTTSNLMVLCITLISILLVSCITVGVIFSGKISKTVNNEINERRKAEEKMKEMANQDMLTKLPNRRCFMDWLKKLINNSSLEADEYLGLLFIDLDGFKLINDSLGHEYGDKVLVEISSRLIKCVRSYDIVSRLGGDEFTVILTKIKDNDEAINICDRIINEVSNPIDSDKGKMFVTASIGVSIFNNKYKNDYIDENILITEADNAMYEAKNKGKNRFEICKKPMYS
ncbi:MAG: GGDEF domain-containing protein [Bacillota bacterium]|nr:GGDEF domain-containing protein [Bacillota bacterium]